MAWVDGHEYARRSKQGPVGRLSTKASATRMRLYCLPHAGGTARIFHRWQKLLRNDIEICALDYPGHGSRIGEPLLDNIEQMAQSIADRLATDRSVPYALLGHSMGSLVAFETCRARAARAAAMPSLLIACGHRAPHVPRSSAPMHDAAHEVFVAHLRELGATPQEVFNTPELLDMMLPILRTDFRACETYSPRGRPRLPVPIAVYGGLGDEDTSRDTLLAWQAETAGPCVVRMFPGGHFFIRERAEQVVSMLERDLIGALATERKAPGRADEELHARSVRQA
jgi:medium-chain acyl-[acyl-carrier-protein] hydrolase